jgi:hypothetical protein
MAMTRSRNQERVWCREQAHTVAETRARLQEITSRLPIREPARRAVVDATLEAARYFAMECTYANYELRTGFAYSPERRALEEGHAQANWQASLARLDRALGG